MRVLPALLPVLVFGPLVAAPQPESRAPDLRVTYRTVGEIALDLEVFRPADWKASDQRAAIVFFFGGGWVSGSTSQFHPQATHLATRGMVAMCADYRVAKRHGTSPFDAVADAKAAVRWLWRHAREQGVDPAKIVVAGGSAGGHLAACCGVVPGFEEVAEGEPRFLPAALVLFNPVIDTSPEGFGHNKLKERYREISPLAHVHAQTAATLIMVGTADTTTPATGDEAFAARMKELGRTCRLERYDGQRHGFFNPRGDREHYWKTLRASEEFLEELGLLK